MAELALDSLMVRGRRRRCCRANCPYAPLRRSGTEKIQVENLPVKGNLPRGVEQKKIDFESVVYLDIFACLVCDSLIFSRGHVLNLILSNNLGDQLTLPFSPHPTTPSLFFVAAPSSSVNPREFF
jgi:hypothetical protein